MSVVHRYQPMVPQKVASEEEVRAMHERLKQRVNVGSGEQKLPDGAQSPPAPTSHAKPLEWEKPKAPDATGLKTKCGRYSCAKITTNGKLSYELWKLAPGGGWFRQLNAGLDNFLQVQKLAQLDADRGTP